MSLAHSSLENLHYERAVVFKYNNILMTINIFLYVQFLVLQLHLLHFLNSGLILYQNKKTQINYS